MDEVNVSHVVRLYTLLLLKKQPMHGYELIREIGEIRGEEPSTSHVYPFLEKLDDRGLVEVEERGDRGKKVYSLTGEGENFVEEQAGSLGKLLSASIEGSLTECSHCGALIYEGGVEVEGEIYCCEHCAEAEH